MVMAKIGQNQFDSGPVKGHYGIAAMAQVTEYISMNFLL